MTPTVYDNGHPKKRAFLSVFSHTCSITEACRAAKISRQSHYDWLKADPGYRKAFEVAAIQAGDALEDVAIKRAKEGSDTLLIFLLKGAKPEKYRERYDSKLTGTGPNGEIEVTLGPAVERLEGRMLRIADRRRTQGSV